MAPISIAMVDDHQLLLDGLKRTLEDHHDISVKYISQVPEEAIEWLHQNEVNILLMDLSFRTSEMSGLEASQIILDKYPWVSVIIVSGSIKGSYVDKVISIGASGYVLKESAGVELYKAIKEVSNGGRYYSAEVMKVYMDFKSMLAGKQQVEIKLTRREKEILELIVAEHSSQEIANMLSIDITTVETHRKNLRNKLKVKNTAGLVREAVLHRLISLDSYENRL